MRGPPVGRQLCALLLVLLSPAAQASVSAFDCTNDPNPMQIVKQVGVYKLIELDISTGVYSDVHTVQLDTAVDAGGANPSYANAFAINPTDDIAYGKFTDGNTQDFLCRFAADQIAEPMECLCALSAAGKGGATGSGELNSATIVNDIYYVGMGTKNLRTIPSVSTCFANTSCFAPGAPSPFTQCPGAWIFGNRADGFGGSLDFAVDTIDFDVGALNLNIASLTAQFGWNELDYSTNSRYLRNNLYTYDSGTDSVSTFRPCGGNGNTYLDINPYTFGGTTYLILSLIHI